MIGARLVIAAVCVLAVAGCSRADDAPSGPVSSTTPSPTPGAAGPFFGLCGSVTDAEVLGATKFAQFSRVTRNSVGCAWEESGTTGATANFSWYRGSPIGRERAGSDLIGRPAEDIEIDGHAGFEGKTGDYLCEVGIRFGSDFIHWSIAYSPVQIPADPCDVAQLLSALAISRAAQ